MKSSILVFILGLSLVAAAEREYLWPEGKMPNVRTNQIAAMTRDREKGRMPYLDWMTPPTNAIGKCMVLISGGGYNNCCDTKHVDVWNELFTAAGFQCVNLVYRTPRPEGLPFYQSAWEDGQRAIRKVRSAAALRGFDPEMIGTVSMSAGSHLATLLAVSSETPAYPRIDETDDVSAHLNWAITGAIAYALTDGLGVPNSTGGNGIDVRLDDIFKFDAKTAPMCMFHGGNDLYSPIASTRVFRKLRELKIPAELHLYNQLNHGFWGWNPDLPYSPSNHHWFEQAMEFLNQLGVMGKLPPGQKLVDRYADDTARASVERLPVWPEGKIPDFSEHQLVPYLEWHTPKELKSKAIQIIYSGGCYTGNDPNGFEVAPARRRLNELGINVVTLHYRTPRPKAAPKHQSAWQDLQRTVRIVRSEAAKRNLNPEKIGIMGSSAGGHLTLMGVTSSRTSAYTPIDELDSLPCHVNWGIAIYPAYALSDGANAPNTTSGVSEDAKLVSEFAFDDKTCPMLFVHGDEDVWAAMNSVKCWEKLRTLKCWSDLHVICRRGHCFQGFASPGTGSYNYLNRIVEFLNYLGVRK